METSSQCLWLAELDVHRKIGTVPRNPNLKKSHSDPLLPARVARCRRNSLALAALACAPRTPPTCPPNLEMWPGFQIWYVQMNVSSPSENHEHANALGKLEKSHSPEWPPIGSVCAPGSCFSRSLQRTHPIEVGAGNSQRKVFCCKLFENSNRIASSPDA